MKPVRIRPRADAEIDALADYIAADSPSAALRFLDATQKAFELISEQPEIGSKRYAKPPVLQGLRMCPVPDFPKHWIFYIERPDHIDVLRVLHGARDIPAALQKD
jgi:toxin ParE1/3/4